MSSEQPNASLLATAADLRVLIAQLRRKLSEQTGPNDFTPAQLAVMSRLLHDGPATLSTLARAEGMRPQSMSAIVSALEAARCVAGAPDPSDGRQTILSLTDHATDTILAWRAAKNDWLSRTIQEKFTESEQSELARSVELLKRLLEP
jgi:DNA-binding MarR family transcriptional regulator